jgi:acetyl esterase/lipase
MPQTKAKNKKPITKAKSQPQAPMQHVPFYKKKPFLIGAYSLGLVILIVFLGFRFSPWPGALVVRTVFNKGGRDTLAAMEQKLPDYPVSVLKDQQYRLHDKAAKLDVYAPKSVSQNDQPLPLVIWTHGGAWLSGDKKDFAPYYERLASQGYIVAAVNYSLAPDKAYPTAVHQLNEAYLYLVTNAKTFHLDPNRIILAGDSAGAQLSSQMAALITSPAYAKEVGISPHLKPEQLAGVVLYCGIYKMEKLAHPDDTLPKVVGWGNDVAIWSYTGKRDYSNDPVVREMSPYYHVTKDFPAAFISGGNADALTDVQSKPLAQKLTSLGAGVTTLFYPKDHKPALEHEYQFTFNDDGEKAFAQMLEFIKAKTQ